MSNETPNVTAPTNFLTATPVNSTDVSTPKVELGYNPADFTSTGERIEKPAETTTQETKVETAPTVKDTSESERAHKLAQMAKTERRLQQQQKEADALIKKAESFKGAFESTDLIDSLTKLGLQPNDILRKLTEAAIKNPETPKTPEQLKEESIEKRMKVYEDNLNKVTSELAAEKEAAAHMSAITNSVAPVIKGNLDKYEASLNVYGGVENLIKEVYTEMYNTFVNTGEVYSAEMVADTIEEHWSNTFEGALKNAKSFKKFGHYFKDEVAEAKKVEESITNKPLSHAERLQSVLADYAKENPKTDQETYEPPKTLTNNMNIGPSSDILSPMSDRKSQIARFMKELKS